MSKGVLPVSANQTNCVKQSVKTPVVTEDCTINTDAKLVSV